MPRAVPIGSTVVYEDTVNPTATSDRTTIGARFGHLWCNTATETWFVCRDATASAAKWDTLYLSGGNSALMYALSGVPLIDRDFVHEFVTFSRNHTADLSVAFAPGKTSGSLTAYYENSPRFSSPSGRFLIEDARINRVQRPTQPDQWTTFGGTGSPTITANALAAPDGTTSMARFNWGANTGSVAVRITTASVTNSATHRCSVYCHVANLGGATLVQMDLGDGTPVPVGSQIAIGQTVRLEAAIVSGTSEWLDLQFNNTTGGLDIYLWGAQVEETASGPPSNLIVPAVQPNSGTRDADVATVALSAINSPATGAGTYVFTAMLPFSAASGVDQPIFQIDSGSDSNRIRLRNVAAGNTVTLGRVTGGTSVDAGFSFTMVPGTEFTAAISVSGSGTVSAAINGTNIYSVTGAPTSGLTTIRLGATFSGVLGNGLEFRNLVFIPTPVSTKELAALSSTPPAPIRWEQLALRPDFREMTQIVNGDSNLAITKTNGGALILVTSGTRTHTLPLLTNIPTGWRVVWKNRSGNTLTVNTSGEIVNAGGTSFTLATGGTITAVAKADRTWETF
jgi:hypothetical protein